MFEVAVTKAAAVDKPDSLDRLHLETLDECTCLQTLHIGSYDDEADILDQKHHQIHPGARAAMVKHDEIYGLFR